ncbi:MAG: UDP-N-acetylmuramoyl-L-alanyl-D-glutamate--2,6-diaminopimelate ligase [Firmicutes bacterium]|nr:UDP-N-acetylmuramoyl-L-alanyl-D-glutamate--2,6-diaminopimelate ligase [Bacillota bacterium]
MKLKNLIEGLDVISVSGKLDVDIEGIAYDSRTVMKNCLFVSISGNTTNGHYYIEEVITKGAVAIMVEKDVKIDSVTVIKVASSRDILHVISSRFYNYPTNMLKLIGITGTNGKTTTAYMVKSILECAGKNVGLIGTIAIEIGNKKIESVKTTPESPDLQRLFKEMVNESIDYGVMEVSSHSLEFRRVDSCNFYIGAFTNLSQDHLDFHKTMENYRKVKEKLFYMTKHANIINIDDQEGRLIINNIKNTGIPLITFGIEEKADIMARDISLSSNGVKFNLITPKYTIPINSSIPGKFSIYNCLTAAAIGYAEDIPKEAICKGIESLYSVSGRLEVFDLNTPYKIIIDYAHTPAGLENVLITIRHFIRGNLITVFGCGGDRDKSKRATMGRIAGIYSDYCILTSDNPRTENPISIIKEIEIGIRDTNCSYLCIENRREAIKHAMALAKYNDVILLAGKGHETYQVLNNKTIDFDEREIVKELLEEGT